MSGERIKITHVKELATLTIDGTRTSDAGDYVCRASNKLGDAETRSAVQVGLTNGSGWNSLNIYSNENNCSTLLALLHVVKLLYFLSNEYCKYIIKLDISMYALC